MNSYRRKSNGEGFNFTFRIVEGDARQKTVIKIDSGNSIVNKITLGLLYTVVENCIPQLSLI